MRRNSTLILLLSGLLAFLGPVGCGHAGQNASYGTRLKYKAGQKIEFADFAAEYLGERRQTMPVYPRELLYCDFKISGGKTEKVVSWTAGTGDIAPAQFEIAGKNYQLELRRSDQLGKLKDNELVIWQANGGSR